MGSEIKPLTDEEIRVVRESTLSFASSKTYDEDDQLRAEFERDRRWLATLDALRARAEAAEKKAEKIHGILRELEWGDEEDDGDGAYCVFCMSYHDEQHNAGCQMAEAIAEAARTDALSAAEPRKEGGK